MGIKIEVSGSYVDFGTSAPLVSGYTQSTHLIWVYPTLSMSSGAPFVHQISQRGPLSGSNNGWQLSYNPNASGQLQLSIHWSTTDGLWRAPTISINTLYMISVTYDGGGTSNNPAVRYNNVAKSVTRVTAPVGSYGTDNGNIFYLGDDVGIFYAYLIYNRILSATEITDAYNNGLVASPYGNYIPSTEGLVFRPNLMCAKGLSYSNFPGTTLGASNKIVDMVGCLDGTPTGTVVAT